MGIHFHGGEPPMNKHAFQTCFFPHNLSAHGLHWERVRRRMRVSVKAILRSSEQQTVWRGEFATAGWRMSKWESWAGLLGKLLVIYAWSWAPFLKIYLPELCWIVAVKVDTLVLFLTLGKIVGRFFTVWATRAEKLWPEKFRQHHGQGTKWPGGDVRDQHSLWSKKSKDFKN